MDIKEIIKTVSDKTRIHFIRNLKKPDHYIIKEFSDKGAYQFILKSLHLPPHQDSGYKDLKVQWAFAIECEGIDKSKFCYFLKHQMGKYLPDEDEGTSNWLGDNGWYELFDINNPAKWLESFHNYQMQRQTEFLKSNSTIIQKTLF